MWPLWSTAGTIAVPSNTAYGSWEFDWYKGGDSNEINVGFINDRIPFNVSFVACLSNGYYFRITSAELITFGKNNIGVSAALLNATVSSYIAINTWYRLRLTRSNSGIFTFLIKGGSFTPTAGYDGWTLVSTAGGSGTNPVTDTTYSTSNYFVLDIDAGDRIANMLITNGLKA